MEARQKTKIRLAFESARVPRERSPLVGRVLRRLRTNIGTYVKRRNWSVIRER